MRPLVCTVVGAPVAAGEARRTTAGRCCREVDKENAVVANGSGPYGDGRRAPRDLERITCSNLDARSNGRLPFRVINKEGDAPAGKTCVPKLNLDLLRRAAESLPAASPLSATKKGPGDQARRGSSKNGELSVSQSSADSGHDFSSQAEHMDDEELKFILRRQYKKVTTCHPGPQIDSLPRQYPCSDSLSSVLVLPFYAHAL